MTKLIFDPIHKYIPVDPIALQIIDHPIFKRLKNIKQLGLCYEVFPGASHNRFEHSLGVYYLTGKMINTLLQNQPNLQITKKEILHLTIAGLCHDLGHGPFSHVFDNEVIPELTKHKIYVEGKTHEERSCILLRFILEDINKKKILFSKEDYNQITSYIHPKPKNKGWKYQIVANQINGIDVDKFDYLARDAYNIGLDAKFDSSRLIQQARVIDGNICYPDKLVYTILHMFSLRYQLFREVCNHPTVKCIEYMIRDVLLLSDDYIQITKRLNNKEFAILTDDILSILNFLNYPKIKNLLVKIQYRKLYKYIGEYQREDVENWMKGTLPFSKDQILLHNLDIGYSNASSYPLERVKFYSLKDPNVSFYIPKNKLLRLTPATFTENNTIRIFSRKNHFVIKKYFDNNR